MAAATSKHSDPKESIRLSYNMIYRCVNELRNAYETINDYYGHRAEEIAEVIEDMLDDAERKLSKVEGMYDGYANEEIARRSADMVEEYAEAARQMMDRYINDG